MSLFKGHKKRDNKVSDAELHAVEHSVLGGRRILWAGLAAVSTEMSLHVLAYNLKRVMNITEADRCSSKNWFRNR